MATDKQVAARGMERVVGVEPIFAVTDVARSVAHYERLGFTTSHHDATYAFAHRDRLTIHLAQTDSPGIARTGSIYMHVDDADRLPHPRRPAGGQALRPRGF